MSLKDSLIGFMVILIWGFNFVVISWGVHDMPPLLLGTLRFIGLALIGVLFVKRPAIPWYWLAAYAFVLCFGQFAFLFSALYVGMPAGLASVVLQSQAVFTILFSIIILKESIKKRQIVAILLSGLGLIIIVNATQYSVDSIVEVPLLGFIFTIIAAVMWGFGNVINRMINQRGYRADIGLVAWSAWFAVIPFFLTSIFVEGMPTILNALVHIQWRTIGVVIYLVIVASLLGYGAWSYLLSKYEVGQVVPLTLGVPVVGIISTVIFLEESMTPMQYVGSGFVMLGICLNLLGKPLLKFIKKRFNGRAIKAC